MEETFWSKLSSESIKIPSKVPFVLVLSEASPTDASVGVLKLKSKCHFPGLALMIILKPVKKFVREFNSEITGCVTLAQEYGVVSSA